MAQKYFSKTFRKLFLAVAIAAPGLLCAGNIPQYTVSKGTNKYAEFSDGQAIPFSAKEGDYAIFPNALETPNPKTGEGFSIGFDFRFGGQIFDQFIVDSFGRVYLGKGEVAYRGGAFTLGMTPIKQGLYQGKFSYKTTGTEGNRVLNIQLANAILREKDDKGKYALQIRLYEADGTIEMAFNEKETTYSTYHGFETALHGWSTDDALLVTAQGLDKPISVSSDKSLDVFNSNTYVVWDTDDYTHYYKPVFVFTPCLDTNAPTEAPENLQLTQTGSTLKVTCDKAQGAATTVILYSTEPITDADLPIDGETFKIGTVFGNAKTLYYGDDDNISLEIPNVSSSGKYYICAMSANGYPAYGRENRVTKIYTTAQEAPSNFTAIANGAEHIDLSWDSDYNVIIAKTTEKNPAYQVGYSGVFGTPNANAKVGDVLPDGGEIVYVGNAKSAQVEVNHNTLTFFRAWSENAGQLSTTTSDTYGVGTPSFPYEPSLEYYPFGEQLQIWSATQDQFIPWKREYKEDEALRAVSVQGAEVSLTSPAMEMSTPMRITFEFSLETVRPVDGQGVPMGNEAGRFGNGALSIEVEGEIQKSVSEYNGTMKVCPDGFESGSSTYEEVSVDIPAFGKDKTFTIKFNTEETSYLYLRNIKVERIAEEPKAPLAAPIDAVADEDKSAVLYFYCKKADDADNTLVLFSENPITKANYPEDGVIPAVGSKSNGVIVLYYGSDDEVKCQTNFEMIVPDYGKTYYFVALSASANPLYNRENVAKVEYTTMKEAGKATLEEPDFDGNQLLLTVKGSRHKDAASTLILLSENKFDGTLEDGRQYTHGDEVGNARVIYHGSDETINYQTNLVEANKTYTLTAISANERGWWSDSQATYVFMTNATGVESIDIDASDLSNAEIYNVMGIRINVNNIDELPKGIYIINGVKVIVK